MGVRRCIRTSGMQNSAIKQRRIETCILASSVAIKRQLRGDSCLGLVKEDNETFGLVSVSLSEVSSRSHLVNEKLRQSCLSLASLKK